MIVLAKLMPSRPGFVLTVEWRPRDRKIAKQAAGKAGPRRRHARRRRQTSRA